MNTRSDPEHRSVNPLYDNILNNNYNRADSFSLRNCTLQYIKYVYSTVNNWEYIQKK